MTPGIGPCEVLAGAQTRAGVGNRVIGLQSARLQVEQMDGPGVAIAVVFGRQQKQYVEAASMPASTGCEP